MDSTQQHPETGPDTAEDLMPGPGAARLPLTRWWARRRRDAWFTLLALALGAVTAVALQSASARLVRQVPTTQTARPQSGAVVRPAQARSYSMPQPNAGLMQPAVDAEGNVWVGEMTTNLLARLDPHTGIVTTWEPPNGQSGIMDTAIDGQGKVWFVEQNANYLGRFDPVTQTFATFPLGRVNGHSVGPQDLQFDTSGKLWFTELECGGIGRLDPATGTLQSWPVPPPAPGTPSYPFALAVTRDGQIWFGDLAGGAVGHLDPATGHVTLYHLADAQAQVFAMTSDAQGRVWFTELDLGKLGMIDPATGRVTELEVPTTLGIPAGLYGVVVTLDGDVWFASNDANALIRYAPGTKNFTFYQLAVPSSIPYGVALDSADRLWFTTDGASTNSIGELSP